jgi:Tfp pilus assembly protein PilF
VEFCIQLILSIFIFIFLINNVIYISKKAQCASKYTESIPRTTRKNPQKEHQALYKLEQCFDEYKYKGATLLLKSYSKQTKTRSLMLAKSIIKSSSTFTAQLLLKFQNETTDRHKQEARTCLIEIPFQ